MCNSCLVTAVHLPNSNADVISRALCIYTLGKHYTVLISFPECQLISLQQSVHFHSAGLQSLNKHIRHPAEHQEMEQSQHRSM